jgi:hypothetical protein
VRDVLALIFCGNRICEVITATLGPLPLDQLQKSKPVTPYAVLTDPTRHRQPFPEPGREQTSARDNARRRASIPAPPVCLAAAQTGKAPGRSTAAPRDVDLNRALPWLMRRPPRALAVAETRPQGP